ncbi:hypothetical protein GN956_G10331 [Arapaima gigas]
MGLNSTWGRCCTTLNATKTSVLGNFKVSRSNGGRTSLAGNTLTDEANAARHSLELGGGATSRGVTPGNKVTLRDDSRTQRFEGK